DNGMALIGKGITFDSGGISIKPAAGMEAMKGDMSGGAAIIAAMWALGKLRPRINVTALIPTAENMPSGTAIRPGDVLRAMNGKTIGAISAAKFLHFFAEDTPWAHIDMAGTDDSDKDKGIYVKGSTGIPTRTLINLVLEMARRGKR